MIYGLYLITDENRDGRLLERVAAALRGGVRVVQYRQKGLPGSERRAMATALRELCHRHDVLFLINDDPLLAKEVGADGVHLGQGDGSVAVARQILGAGKRVGVSTRTVEQARQAQSDGADYIGLGAMFPTASKGEAVLVGPQRLREVRRATALPIVAIGGIDYGNAGELIESGADAVAVISAVMADADPTAAARQMSLLFHRLKPFPRGRILTIAGSDSGGGAGIQADLKTITLLGGYGMTALTALTAQNTLGVTGIHPVPPVFVAQQIETVLTDIGADVVKTGMLFSPAIIGAVATAIAHHSLLAVVDPVMIAKGGAPLLQAEAVAALQAELLPRTFLLTPNLPEAEALTGLPVRNEREMECAARRLQKMGARHVLIKGGHLAGEAVDLLLAGNELHRFAGARIDSPNTHGTGCTTAAAIATFLAQGWPLPAAVGKAKEFVSAAIRTALPLGKGHGPVNHWQAAHFLKS